MARVVRSTIYLYNSESSILPFMQGDTTLVILTLFGKHNKPFSPSDVALIAERADKSIRIQNININIQNNTLKIMLHPEIVDVAGAIRLQLKFTDNNGIISSHIINGIVDPDILNNQTAVTASELNDALRIFGRPSYIDTDTNTWWVYDTDVQDFVDTGVTAGDAVVDSVFDINSDRAVANKTVTTKFSETDNDIADLDMRVTTIEQSGGGGTIAVDTNFDINSGNAIANKTVTAKFVETDDDITQLKDKTNTVENDIGELRTDINDNTALIGNINNDIDNLDNDIGNITNSISDITNDINNINTEINQLRVDTDSNASLIDDIETDINDIDNDLSALDNRVTTLEQSGTGVVDTAFDINSDNAIANKTVTEKFDYVDGDIVDLEEDIQQLRTDVDNNITAINDDIDGIETAIGDIASVLDNILGEVV